jgi:monoamine oxidase
MSVDADVIIIGAGAAGIAAAIELQSTNLTFLVLEARNRIGGRAHTDQETFTPIPIDLGASWIHSYGPRNVLYNHHKSFNVDQEQHTMGDIRLYLDYNGQHFTSETLYNARIIFSEISDHLESYSFKKNKNEDQSIEQVMQSKYERLITRNGPVKRLVDLYLSGEEQYDGSNLSHLSAKQWGVGSGSGGDHWVSFGYGNLLERIAKKHHLLFRLNTLVTQIDTTDPDRIAITLANDSSLLYCRRVILTIPLGCLKQETIFFQPPLPDWKRDAINQMGMGLMNKLIVQFRKNFWDADLRSISHACNERRGRFRFTLCIPPPANILILFVTGLFARELETLTDTQILEEVMKFLRKIFPRKTISNPINYKFTRWLQDPLAYGSYSNFPVHAGPHTIEQLAKATSDGRVQWAGEHANIDDGTEEWSYGCVHSAFQSGQRAAKTIRDQLCTS